MKRKLAKTQTNGPAPATKSDQTFTWKPGVKTVTVQGMIEGSRHTHRANSAKPRRPMIPRMANGSAIGPAGDVLSRGQKTLDVSGLSSAPKPGFDGPMGRRMVASVQSEPPLLAWYCELKADRDKRVRETARVVSHLLADGLRQADKTMTLPQLVLAFAAISVEIVSGRDKPGLQDRIERILLDASNDDFHDSGVDDYNEYDLYD